MKKLFGYLRDYKKECVLGPLFKLLEAAFELLVPLVMAAIIAELTHKGEWFAWFSGALLCAVNALLILFADELFRWTLRFHIRDADYAEPSDWEIAGRYISWTVFPVMALAVFIVGLQ